MKTDIDIFQIFNSLRNDMKPVETLTLVYVLYAWKKLSDSETIDPEWNFDSFYRSMITVDALREKLVWLAQHQPLFEYYLAQQDIADLTDTNLINFVNFIISERSLPPVAKAFNDVYERLGRKTGQFGVPEELVDLLVKFAAIDTPKSMYVPFTQYALLPSSLVHVTEEKVYVENNYLDRLIFELIRVLDEKNIEYSVNDPILEPHYTQENAPHLLRKFDTSVAIPPFGMRRNDDYRKHDVWNRFHVSGATQNAELPMIEHMLSQSEGRSFIVISHGLLFRTSKERLMREFMINEKKVEGLINLPANIFSHTAIPSAILVLNNQKRFDDVLFIDAERLAKREGKKNIIAGIDEILALFKGRDEKENLSALVSTDQIAQNDYNLTMGKYLFSEDEKQLLNLLDSISTERLGSIASLQRSQLIKDEESPNGEVYGMVMISDLPKAGYIESVERSITVKEQVKKAETYRLQSYDILLGVKGSTGKVSLVGDIGEEKWLANQSLQVIRLNDEVKLKENAIALYMYLKSNVGQQQLAAITSGTAIQQIPTKALKELRVPWQEKQLKERALKHFEKEVELWREIHKLEDKIADINKSFFIDTALKPIK